ncbi:hypothetical protein [Granulicella arctica]|uniref:hypothetical protein n=1 Tax=Granulicella arctica TaxID=940613 RepID=UPI0021E07BC8|nr:hypothetical protein [Granulicella arctica]
MALFLKNLFLGVLSVGLAAYGMSAGAQVERTNFRLPVVPVQMVAEIGPQASIEDELHVMSSQAGVIFAGEVLKITEHSQQGSVGSGWVDVEFRVEEAIRGCVGQRTYELREWAGLWAGGIQRYRVGERLLMLLHVPSASGMSSPVGGQDGAIPLVGNGVAPTAEDSFADVGEQAVDLRWIQARLLRTASRVGNGAHGRPVVPVEPILVGRSQNQFVTRKDTAAGGRRLQPGIPGNGGFVQAPVTFAGVAGGEGSQGSTLRVVIAMLGAWETEQANAAR